MAQIEAALGCRHPPVAFVDGGRRGDLRTDDRLQPRHALLLLLLIIVIIVTTFYMDDLNRPGATSGAKTSPTR